jgi:hypothetical protein
MALFQVVGMLISEYENEICVRERPWTNNIELKREIDYYISYEVVLKTFSLFQCTLVYPIDLQGSHSEIHLLKISWTNRNS